MEEITDKPTDGRGLRFLTWSGQAAALIICILGIIMLLAAFDNGRFENEKMLSQPDAVFGFSIQSVLLLAAVIHILVGVGLLLTRDFVIKAVLIFWLSSICIAYQIGLALLTAHKPGVLKMLISQKIGLKPIYLDHLLDLLLICLLSIGMAMITIVWHRLKQMRMATFMQRYRQLREQGILSRK